MVIWVVEPLVEAHVSGKILDLNLLDKETSMNSFLARCLQSRYCNKLLLKKIVKPFLSSIQIVGCNFTGTRAGALMGLLNYRIWSPVYGLVAEKVKSYEIFGCNF